MRETGAETIVIACTIVSASYEITAPTDPEHGGRDNVTPDHSSGD